jgi:hypothetical protein
MTLSSAPGVEGSTVPAIDSKARPAHEARRAHGRAKYIDIGRHLPLGA